MKYILTIAIPTYGRNETLARTLPVLLKQLDDDCRVLILDNCSPVAVRETVEPIFAQYPNVKWDLVRHKANIGAIPNILRCFELCETEWIWTLGDDDVLCSDAVATIRRAIAENHDTSYFSFLTQERAARGERKLPIITFGIEDFVAKVDQIHGINFMSCSVWRAEAFAGAMNQAYYYAYAMGWSIALLLYGLGSDRRAILSDKAIIADSSVAPISLRWSFREFMIGWPLLLEVPLKGGVRKTFRKKMLSMHSPENLVAYMLGVAGVDSETRVLYYKLASSRIALYKVHFLGRIRFFIYRALFWHPSMGWRLVKSAIRLANRLGLKNIDIADLEGRRSVSQ